MHAIAIKLKSIYRYQKELRFFYWSLFLFVTYLVLLIKYNNIVHNNDFIFFTIYSLAVSSFLLSRFLIAHFYVTEHISDENYEPTLTFGVPVKNEEKEIYNVLMKLANSNYPKEKFNIIVVDDGSTDSSYQEMIKAKNEAARMGVKIEVIKFDENKGKRYGMYECAKRSKNEVIIFIDSDSLVEPNTAKNLVKYLKDPEIGAVTAHTYVENKNVNLLTRMQNIKYFVSFKAFKAAEAIFGTVTCCSGPCSAYRASYLREVMDNWLNQKFLGVQCTYGDDRSLTNSLLEKGYKTLYSPEAKVFTFVPENMSQYKKQQIRWKKSWTRESIRLSKNIWKRNPIMALSFYLTLLLTIIAPFIVLRAFIYYPLAKGQLPYFYLLGVLLMSVIYGIYYMIYTNDKKWFLPVLALIGYSIIYVWQLPYAIITIKDSKWGTR